MWCSHCNKETTSVPTRTADGICCSQCGSAYFQEKPTEDAIRKARDIISRWSSSDLLDRISTLPEIPPLNRHQCSEAEDSNSRPAESADMSTIRQTAAAEDLPPDRPEQRRDSVDSVAAVPPEIKLDRPAGTPNIGHPAGDDQAPENPPEEALSPQTADRILSEADGPAPAGESSPPKSPPLLSETVGESTDDARPEESLAETVATVSGSESRAQPVNADTADTLNSPEAVEPVEVGSISAPVTPAPVTVAVPAERETVAASAIESENTKASTAGSESTSHEPLPAVVGADSRQSSSPPKRMSQSRASLQRPSRPRKQPASVSDEGTKSMSRKFRIDTPGGERAEQPASEPKNVAGGKIQSNSQTGRRHRIDSGTTVADTLETGDRRTRTQGRPRRRYIDEAHDSVARGPHFQVTAPRRSNFTSITGQFLAYVGVLGLTVGTAMVIYGHFGGYSEYTPTGWLVTTVAQMMLFLGVINLVSGGMEQTNSDVSQRMEYLGSQLMRIEQVAEEALRGPKISAGRYADPDAEVAVSEREQAVVED